MRKPGIAALGGVALICLSAFALSGCTKAAQGCDNGVLTVHRSHTKFVVDGFCETLVIDGSYLTVGGGAADRVSVNGDYNKLESAVEKSLTINGSNNQGDGAQLGTVAIHGNGNSFGFDGFIENLKIVGNRNYIDSDDKIYAHVVKGKANTVLGENVNIPSG